MRIGFGLGLTYGRRVTGFSPASLFTLGEAGGFYDPSDLSTVWQDSAGTTPGVVNQPVGRLSDKSGNSNHLLQATTAAKPVLRQSGSLYYLEFDGVDDLLRADFPASMSVVANPVEYVIALRNSATWGGTAWSGGTGGGATGFNGAMLDDGVSPQAVFYNDAFDTVLRNGGLALSANGVAYARAINTAGAGTLSINRTVTTTGNPGVSAIGGHTIGNRSDGASPKAIRYYGGMVRGNAAQMSGAERAAAENFFAAKAGVTLP